MLPRCWTFFMVLVLVAGSGGENTTISNTSLPTTTRAPEEAVETTTTRVREEVVETTTTRVPEVVVETTNTRVPEEAVETTTTRVPEEAVETTTRVPEEAVETTTSAPGEEVETTTTSVPEEAVETTTTVPKSEMSQKFIKEGTSLPTTRVPGEAVETTTTWAPDKSVETTTTVPKPEIFQKFSKEGCGLKRLHRMGRVVGGRDAYFGEWPWQVLLQESTWFGYLVRNKCGGVLITSKFVLTAAHCQPGYFSSLVVLLGKHDLSRDIDTLKPVSKKTQRIIVHENYNPDTFENDIALLELDSPVEIRSHIAPICLPQTGDIDFAGKKAFVSGWGKISHTGPIARVLQVVRVPVTSNSVCQQMYLTAGYTKFIENSFLCAGYEHGGKDSCDGDSGGPLMIQRKDHRWVLIGTVSHGIGCADPNLPGVYMRTTSFLEWIKKIIGNDT